MKKLNSLLIVTFALMIANCGEGKKDGVQPADPPITYTQYESGEYYENIPLDGCLEVQSVSAVVVDGEKYSSIHKQINVTINIKMVKDLPMKPDDSKDCKIQLLNEDGAVLQECYAHGVDDVLRMSAGGVGIITGSTEEDSGSNINELFSKVKFIRLAGLSARHRKENPETVTSETSEDSSSSDDTSAASSSRDDDGVSSTIRDAAESARSQMRQVQEEASNQWKQAQEEAREQMRQAQEEAKEQMRQAQEEARRAMGL